MWAAPSGPADSLEILPWSWHTSQHIFSLAQAVQLTDIKYYCTPSIPADIYVGPLKAVHPTALKYYCAPGIQPTYISFLKVVQPTALKYYCTPSVPADSLEILPCFWACQLTYMWAAPSVAADRYEILPHFSMPADKYEYYMLLACQLTYIVPHFKRCSQQP